MFAMASRSLLPYFHPTTTVVVDDNQLFLHTIDLRMPADMACCLHHDPRAALTFVNRKLALPTIPDRCIARDSASWRGTIEFDLSLIEEEIKVTERFKRTSLVIVDYAMPQMNGIEFCQSIADPTVKKLMLTGAADEKTAVKAFNDGLIDRFIPKNERATLDMVVAYAQQLQHDYFDAQQEIIQSAIALEPPPFLAVPALRDWMHCFRERGRYVEHYLVDEPPGFILLTASGDVSQVMIFEDRLVQLGIEFAATHGAPSHVMGALQSRRKLAYFYDQHEQVSADFAWDDYLHDPISVPGADDFLLAIASAPPSDIDFDPKKSSFQSHLDALDQGD